MSNELLYRSFTPDLEVRSGAKERIVYGIALPWDVPMQIDDRLTEQWRSGVFNHQVKATFRVRYAREHVDLGGKLIGRMQEMRNDAKGLYVELKAFRTDLADETLRLIEDGDLPQLSVAFRERAGGNRRLANGTVERVKADLFEVASVFAGAFGHLAAAAGVRSAGDQLADATANLDRARQILAGMPLLPA